VFWPRRHKFLKFDKTQFDKMQFIMPHSPAERLYFDANASYGPYPNKPLEARWSLEHLLEDLDLAEIAGALVYHQQAVFYDPMLGNLRLVEEIAPHRRRLFPCWIALPSLYDDFPAVPEFMRLMKRHDVRAVRIAPERFGIPVREKIWRELRDALRDENILCVLPTDSFAPLLNMDKVLEIFRDCNTLLVGHNWHQGRAVAAWMAEFPKLHVDFSMFQANRAIEYLAARFGAGRCIFGTELPFKAPGAARGFLDWTLLDEDSARLVAGENLRRLLGGIGPKKNSARTQWDDELTRAARRGEPLPCRVLDAHCHILHDDGAMAGEHLVFHKGDAKGMVEVARRIGTEKTAVMSWAAPISLDADAGNAIVENAVRKYPDDLIGLASIHPEYDDDEKMDAVIRHYHGELKFPGLKTFTPLQNIDYDDPLYDKWFCFADAHKLYLVLDPKGGSGATNCVRNLATRYPNMGLHLDHCGRSWEYAKWAVQMAHEFPSVWLQLNFSAVTNGIIEWIVAHAGAERVLYGTDAPMRDPRPQAGWLTWTRLPEHDKRLIFGENFARILEEVRW
jgi:predicted TIM-barrel fold metal-dependent hydrolase